jgi:hypothetical protein
MAHPYVIGMVTVVAVNSDRKGIKKDSLYYSTPAVFDSEGVVMLFVHKSISSLYLTHQPQMEHLF